MSKSEHYTYTWQAPSNIALIKYWGKRGNQLPNNTSLSITLDKAISTTRLTANPRSSSSKTNDNISLDFLFEGKAHAAFGEKIGKYLTMLSRQMPFLNDLHLTIESSNTFPHSAGIASSASSMASLALCMTDLKREFTGTHGEHYDFFRMASGMARLGSGSASRSVYGGWTTWGKSGLLKGSSDEYASPLEIDINPLFRDMGVAVLIVSSQPKSLSSSLGHTLMERHPWAPSRYKQAGGHLDQILHSMKSGDFEEFARVTENEALSLHSLLMTSAPEGLLIKPASLKVIEEVRQFRSKSGIPVCFTMDAGPNVLLIYPRIYKGQVTNFIQAELVHHCENGRWIDDQSGAGPMKIV